MPLHFSIVAQMGQNSIYAYFFNPSVAGIPALHRKCSGIRGVEEEVEACVVCGRVVLLFSVNILLYQVFPVCFENGRPHVSRITGA